MISDKLDRLHFIIINDCLKIIREKGVDFCELAYQIGVSSQYLKQAFKERSKDFSIYLRAYDLLVEW